MSELNEGMWRFERSDADYIGLDNALTGDAPWWVFIRISSRLGWAGRTPTSAITYVHHFEWAEVVRLLPENADEAGSGGEIDAYVVRRKNVPDDNVIAAENVWTIEDLENSSAITAQAGDPTYTTSIRRVESLPQEVRWPDPVCIQTDLGPVMAKDITEIRRD